MRIVHICDTYAPKRGGIEVQLSELAHRQAAQGHDVCVITRRAVTGARSDQPRPSVGSPTQPQVVVLAPTWLSPRSSHARLLALLGGDLFAGERPDVIHVHQSVISPLALLAQRVAHEQSLACVATMHSMLDYLAPLYLAAKPLLGWHRWHIQWSAVSELAAEPLRRLLPKDAQVLVLPNGIDAAPWRSAPHVPDPTRVTAVAVMRLQTRKRPVPLIRIALEAQARLPRSVDLEVLIVGEGPLRRRLLREIRRRHGTGTVRLLGPLDHDQLRRLYARTDVYLAPATLESFGIAALEARCAGVPVIARSGTGITDFIEDGVHGLIVDDDHVFAQALASLARDPDRRAAMAATNSESRPPSDWPAHLELCHEAYKAADALLGPRR